MSRSVTVRRAVLAVTVLLACTLAGTAEANATPKPLATCCRGL
jgi:hypothetical protein